MKLTRVIAITVVAASLGLAANVHAQSLKNVDTPNEFPPTSYKGKQYVDSKGCVYIRAGVDGATTWVPRMTRDRKVICGYKPTNPNAAPTTASAQKLDKNVVFIEPAAAPTTSAVDKVFKPAATTPSTSTTTAKPKATTSTQTATTTTAKRKTTTTSSAATASSTPVQTTKTTKPKSSTPWWKKPPSTTAETTPTTSTTAAKPKTTTVAPAPTAPAPATTTATTTSSSQKRTLGQTPRQSGYNAPCRGGVESSQTVRCGPQSQLPYTPGTGNPTTEPPRIIYKRQGASLVSSYTPAPGTVVREGEVASNVRVIPRHLYENRQYAMRETQVPAGYVRVFDDGRLNPHRAEMTFAGKAATDAIWSQTVPRETLRNPTSAAVISTSGSTSNTATLSTKNAPAEKSIRLSGQRYVQVATYADKAAAQSAARQVRALGMPTKIGKYDIAGQTYRIVLAGPFSNSDKAGRAATKAQNAGYSGAFVRN
ncbi:SPOR domain-containing protein [uncultured Shimia sp.]|uniref:SPOR domain-containing protein n=1 Tax=uncultured Shimia sp. TaxID=573152 RepID=UPI00260DA91B|nr:SPOR domain-containing protein [uncultured Shimia sp.]